MMTYQFQIYIYRQFLYLTLINIKIPILLNKMSKLLLVFLGLIVLATANSIIKTDGDKVKIDFYFESLCPYCQQFISKSLKVAAATKDFWKICDFHLYPYGNARRVQNGTSWSFTCQHGVNECVGNLIETCAIKKYDLYTQALPFIICLEADSSDWTRSGQKCATQLNLDWNLINTCAKSQEGINYQVEMAVATEKLNPAHTYVPWVVVNGQHSSSYENAVLNNMVKFVCSIYTGPEKIDACK